MTENELESFRLLGGLLLLAKQHPGGSASWAVNEIRQLRAEIGGGVMMVSVEAYIPYDLRERLAEQIKVIDKMMLDAVAAERKRCELIIGNLMYESYDITAPECLSRALIAIRKGE